MSDYKMTLGERETHLNLCADSRGVWLVFFR